MYHQPVLLHAAVDGLNITAGGTYVDVTFGGGGHSREILKRLDQGRLIAFDQDPDALRNVPDDDRLMFIPKNFRELKKQLKLYRVNSVDGILADLGVSSHQFDTAERGFSTRGEAVLDMRMNPQEEKSALAVINEYGRDELKRVLREFGELREAGQVARVIERSRMEAQIKTTSDLKVILKPFFRGNENQFLAKVFQALRIEVNDELDVLKEFLSQSLEVLKPGGRLVVISYHSLEDRLVKNFFRSGNFEGHEEKDLYGQSLSPFRLITRKAIVPDEEEISINSRARSAKLRIAEKL